MAKFAIKEKNPPGWTDADVSSLSDHADEPYALAWYLHGKGVKPSDKEAIKCVVAEANAPSQVGQLFRKKAQESAAEPVKGNIRWTVKLAEAAKAGGVDEAKREIPVFILSEGPGNSVDRHYYTGKAIDASFSNFEGAKAYADHPSKIEDQARPERSIRDIVGYYHSCESVAVGGKKKIKAILKINPGDAFTWAWDMLKEALAYAEKFPDKDYVGISINADGELEDGESEGQKWKNVVAIPRVVSADIVTQPAAGGKPLREAAALRESVKAILESGKDKGGVKSMNPKEALMKAAEALKAVRAAMGKVPDHDKAYGPSMDDLHSQLESIGKSLAGESESEAEAEARKKKEAEAKKEGEAAPPPAKDGQLDPVKKEDEAYESEKARYASGKMTEAEKAMFEAWQGERMRRRVKEAAAVVEKKLAESGIPAAFHAELAVLMEGKTEAQMDALITSRKALLESVTSGRVSGGAGSKAPTGKGEGSKLQESLGAAGLLKKGGK